MTTSPVLRRVGSPAWSPLPSAAPAFIGVLAVLGGGMVGWGPGVAMGMCAWAGTRAVRAARPTSEIRELLVVTAVLAAWLVVASFRGPGDLLLLVGLGTWAAGIALGAEMDRGTLPRTLVLIVWIIATAALFAFCLDAPGLVHVTASSRRAAGHVGSPGALAVLSALAVPLAASPRAVALAPLTRSLILTTLVTAVAATGSRTGVVALAVGLWVVRDAMRPKHAVVLVGGALVGIATMHATPSLATTAVSAASIVIIALVAERATAWSWMITPGIVVSLVWLAPTLGLFGVRMGDTRSALWLVGLREFGSSPLTGIGLGNQRAAATASVLHVTRYLHSEPLEVLAGAGLLGFVLLAALMWRAAALLRRRRTGTALMGALAVVATASLFDFTFHMPVMTAIAGLLVGTALRSTPDEDP